MKDQTKKTRKRVAAAHSKAIVALEELRSLLEPDRALEHAYEDIYRAWNKFCRETASVEESLERLDEDDKQRDWEQSHPDPYDDTCPRCRGLGVVDPFEPEG